MINGLYNNVKGEVIIDGKLSTVWSFLVYLYGSDCGANHMIYKEQNMDGVELLYNIDYGDNGEEGSNDRKNKRN